MSAINSRAPESPASRTAGCRPSRRISVLIDVTVAAVVAGMLGLMIALPGHEAAPFHLMFLAVGIAYAYRSWPVAPTLTATAVITLLSGWLMAAHTSQGSLPSAELAEIPLMPLVL